MEWVILVVIKKNFLNFGKKESLKLKKGIEVIDRCLDVQFFPIPTENRYDLRSVHNLMDRLFL